MATKPSSVRRRDSRYVQGGVTEVTKKSVAWWERDPRFNERADDDIIIDSLPVVYAGRPDLLSYDVYRNNNLEWIILQYNNIIDINEEFVAGVRLVLPSVNRVNGSILTVAVTYGDN